MAGRLESLLSSRLSHQDYRQLNPSKSMTAIAAGGKLRKVFSLILLGLGASAFVLAATPEIDPGSGASALTLLAGAVLLLRNKTGKR